MRWVTYKENSNNPITLKRIRENCKVPEPTKKRVACLETGKEYNSIVEAQNDTNINSSNISDCCRGVRKTAGKYHWKYIE